MAWKLHHLRRSAAATFELLEEFPNEVLLVIMKMAARTARGECDRDFIVDVLSEVCLRFRYLASNPTFWRGEEILIRLRKMDKMRYIVNECLSEETKAVMIVGRVRMRDLDKSFDIEYVSMIHQGRWSEFPCQHLHDLTRFRPGKSTLLWSTNDGGVSSSFESIWRLRRGSPRKLRKFQNANVTGEYIFYVNGYLVEASAEESYR